MYLHIKNIYVAIYLHGINICEHTVYLNSETEYVNRYSQYKDVNIYSDNMNICQFYFPTDSQKSTVTMPRSPAADSYQQGPIRVTLENSGLWKSFHSIGTEMIITKHGR